MILNHITRTASRSATYTPTNASTSPTALSCADRSHIDVLPRMMGCQRRMHALGRFENALHAHAGQPCPVSDGTTSTHRTGQHTGGKQCGDARAGAGLCLCAGRLLRILTVWVRQRLASTRRACTSATPPVSSSSASHCTERSCLRRIATENTAVVNIFSWYVTCRAWRGRNNACTTHLVGACVEMGQRHQLKVVLQCIQCGWERCGV